MQLSENAHRVLEARYLRRDAAGKVSANCRLYRIFEQS
jgi:hypothetical protein